MSPSATGVSWHMTSKDVLSLPHLDAPRFDILKGTSFTGVCTDSRRVAAGNLFVALRGETFDGHAFIDACADQGARAAIVDREGALQVQSNLPLLVVTDTTIAYGMLATLHRMKFLVPVIGIGGSNGKTTTKEMIAAVLGTTMAVTRTEANHNNHIGVPATLLAMTTATEAAVVEMGTNHPGEMARLCAIARPTLGLVTNIGREHLEFFDSLDGVEAEERVLFECLQGTRGSLALVNQDEERVRRAVPPGVKTVTYGFSDGARIKGTLLSQSPEGCATFTFRGSRVRKPAVVRLRVPGAHNALNALAAAAVGVTLKVPVASIVQALEQFQPASKRMETLVCDGITIFNDAYNANPDSMIAALRTLAATKTSGKRIAVLGDMFELGAHGPEEHRRVGEEAAALGIDYVLTVGPLTQHLHAAATGTFAVHYDQKNMLAEYLAELVAPGDVVLVKGSRGMKLEDVVTFLAERLRSSQGRPV